VSGVATRLLSRENSRSLAILGSGVQARTHLAAMRAVRTITDVRVWSRSTDHAREFSDRESKRHGIPITVWANAEDAVRDADIICTTTGSRDPILEGKWISPGTHINAVGSSIAVARELDASAVKMSSLFVDRRESTLNEGGDFLIAKQEGAVDDSHILGEIGDVLTGQMQGRRSAEEITLFKSLGLAVEDVASANYIYQKALDTGKGTLIELGGERID
jgi:ornithine cyclodeaminase